MLGVFWQSGLGKITIAAIPRLDINSAKSVTPGVVNFTALPWDSLVFFRLGLGIERDWLQLKAEREWNPLADHSPITSLPRRD